MTADRFTQGMRIALFVVAGCFALPAQARTFDQTIDRSFPLARGGSFTLSNVNGSVEVVGWGRDEVAVHAVKTASGDPSELGLVKIEMEAGREGVAVRTLYPRDRDVEVQVEYVIRVPRQIVLRWVETVNGTVLVRGVDGGGALRSVNGNVEVRDSGGTFSARTTNGNIRMELRHLDAPEARAGSGVKFVPVSNAAQSVETVNGSVVIELPRSAGAELEVSSLNGDFRTQLPVEARSSQDPQVFRGRLGRGGAPLRIRTVNGAIRLLSSRPLV